MKSLKLFMVCGLAMCMLGCAGNEKRVTHEWVANNKQAEKNFVSNNQACQSAGGVAAYEGCMSDAGYELYNE